MSDKEKYTEMIEMFLKDGADPNIKPDRDNDESLLYLAVCTENVNLVVTLLDAGADPNLINYMCDYTPLAGACEYMNLEIIEILLSRGADPNIHKCETPLEWILYSDESIEKNLRV